MKHYCEKCKVVEIPEPEYCCHDMFCGCMGYPIDPPFCASCFEEVFGKPIKEGL